ncbi:hypothetical protein DENSPDRAFT_750710, partial [Dentipellis sp. KUC8613]
SVYGRDWLTVTTDEAHEYRRFGRKYHAIFTLRLRSRFFAALTATPLNTKALDIWNIARIMGIGWFLEHGESALEMEKELASAQRKDRKFRKDNPNVYSDHLHGRGGTYASESSKCMVKWIEVIRDQFKGYVIRRTIASVDHNGAPLINLPPYVEVNLRLTLYPREYEVLDELAEDYLESGRGASTVSLFFAAFYLLGRRGSLHPNANPSYASPPPKTKDDWNTSSSAKLDTILRLVKYHLEADGRPPIVMATAPSSSPVSSPVEGEIDIDDVVPPAGQNRFISHPQEGSRDYSGMPPDKVVLYSFFPMNFDLMTGILEANGIKVAAMSGSQSMAIRASILRQFTQSGRDGIRVLILSGVGTVGLNIAEANILIIVDVMWSVLSEQQLIGRLWRHPQKKTVLVYRLFGEGTPDTLINTLSVEKGQLADAFTNVSGTL